MRDDKDAWRQGQIQSLLRHVKRLLDMGFGNHLRGYLGITRAAGMLVL
jgi:hypothetical protein